MRLFAAVELSDSEREPLIQVQQRLAGSSGLRWTRPENLHLTLRFFGKWPEQRLAELTEVLGAIERPPAPLAAPLVGLRFLPGPHYPRVLMALAEAPPPLLDLQRAIEAGARELGMRPETKPFVPHVTLSRLRDPKQGRPFMDQVEQMKVELGTIKIGGFVLLSSTLEPSGARYDQQGYWPLAP